MCSKAPASPSPPRGGDDPQQPGLAPEAFSYLNSHGSLDLEHMDFFATLMNRLDEDDDRAAVVHTARVVYRLYGDIFRSLPLAA